MVSNVVFNNDVIRNKISTKCNFYLACLTCAQPDIGNCGVDSLKSEKHRSISIVKDHITH